MYLITVEMIILIFQGQSILERVYGIRIYSSRDILLCRVSICPADIDDGCSMSDAELVRPVFGIVQGGAASVRSSGLVGFSQQNRIRVRFDF